MYTTQWIHLTECINNSFNNYRKLSCMLLKVVCIAVITMIILVMLFCTVNVLFSFVYLYLKYSVIHQLLLDQDYKIHDYFLIVSMIWMTQSEE